MKEPGTFETLVLELRDEERRRLLGQLQTATQVSKEVLINRPADLSRPVNYQDAYRQLPFFSRMLVLVKSILFNVSREDLMRGRLVKQLIKQLDLSAKTLFNPRRRVFLEGFMAELQALRQAAKYFYNLLDRTLEKERTAFFAFLASLELDLVHQQLDMETDPAYVLQGNPNASDTDVRLAVNRAMDSAFSMITEEQRRSMYHNVRSLFILKQLSMFKFDRMIEMFNAQRSGVREISILSVTDYLRELDDVLHAFELPPTRALLETVFSFYFADQLADPGFDIEAAIRQELGSTEQALSRIREFNANVPLHTMLQLALDDPELQCDPVAGGEDWFALLRSYWRERIEKRFNAWQAEKKTAELQLRIKSLLGDDWLGSFVYLTNQSGGESPPIRFATVLRCLDNFYHTVFLKEINRCLKLVLLEGEFYKRDNRLDFTDAYNKILELGQQLKAYDQSLAPDGEFGLAYAQARREMSSLAIKRRKLETAIQSAETEADTLIRNGLEALTRMHLVLKGILTGSSRERYDSLSNLSRIEGKANADFMRSLEQSNDKLERMLSLVNELSQLAFMSEAALDLSGGQAEIGSEDGDLV